MQFGRLGGEQPLAHAGIAQHLRKLAAKYLRWQDKAANQKFFAGELQAFSKEAAALLLEVGIIKQIPKIDDIIDTSFIK